MIDYKKKYLKYKLKYLKMKGGNNEERSEGTFIPFTVRNSIYNDDHGIEHTDTNKYNMHLKAVKAGWLYEYEPGMKKMVYRVFVYLYKHSFNKEPIKTTTPISYSSNKTGMEELAQKIFDKIISKLQKENIIYTGKVNDIEFMNKIRNKIKGMILKELEILDHDSNIDEYLEKNNIADRYKSDVRIAIKNLRKLDPTLKSYFENLDVEVKVN